MRAARPAVSGRTYESSARRLSFGARHDLSGIEPAARRRRSSPGPSYRDGQDAPAKLENGQRIERRSGFLFDAQRRGREQKLEAIEPPRLLDRSLEVEIVENIDTHRDQRRPVQRIWGGCRQARRHDVVWPVASDE